MDDLKLIDELLCDIKDLTRKTWYEIEYRHTSIIREAIARLREAYKTNQYELMTLSLTNYFNNK